MKKETLIAEKEQEKRMIFDKLLNLEETDSATEVLSENFKETWEIVNTSTRGTELEGTQTQSLVSQSLQEEPSISKEALVKEEQVIDTMLETTPVYPLWLKLFACLLYALSSSSMTLVNKSIYVRFGFRSPLDVSLTSSPSLDPITF
jgi:hypothetical protein